MRKLCPYASDEFTDIFERFSASVKSRRTIDEYAGYVNLILNSKGKDFLELSSSDAQSYFKMLEGACESGRLSPHTYRVRLSCYSRIAEFIQSGGFKANYRNPFGGVERIWIDFNTVHESKIPSPAELDIMADVLKDDPMVYLIFTLAARVGMSTTDILAIRYGMLGINGGRYYVTYPPKTSYPGDTSRVVMLPEDVSELMRDYLLITVPDEQGHIFFNKYGKPLSIRSIDGYMDKAYAKSGLLKKYTLKDFRSRAILELANIPDVTAEDIADYTGLKMDRAQCYASSKSKLKKGSLADLTNIRFVNPNRTDVESEVG